VGGGGVGGEKRGSRMGRRRREARKGGYAIERGGREDHE
jgi:hypothetical protein